MRLITICLMCKHKTKPVNGKCDCTGAADRVDILERAKAGSCPRGLYPAEIPVDHDAEKEKRRMQQGGCCGQASREV